MSDGDRARAFYVDQVGFSLDHDVTPSDTLRVVQLTPPGPACSIVMGTGLSDAPPGSVQGLHLVVADIPAARAALASRGVDMSELGEYSGGINYVPFRSVTSMATRGPRRPLLASYGRDRAGPPREQPAGHAASSWRCSRPVSTRVTSLRTAPPAPKTAGLAKPGRFVQPGDVLVVWKLDRLGRSLSHLLTIVNTLQERQVAFRSLTEALDTTTPTGEFLFHVFGALAQYERALTQERVRAGLAAAKRRGRCGGRPPAIVGEKLDAILVALDSGMSKAAVCRNFGVKRTTLIETLAQVGPPVAKEAVLE